LDNALKSYSSYLGGQWISTDAEMNVVNPATAQPFAKVSKVDLAAVKKALDTAEAALPAWRNIVQENGKPYAQAEGEVGMSEEHLRWFAEEGRRVYGRLIPQQTPSKRHMVVKTPIGVVGAIAPWNFPLVLSVRKVAPALAAGCPVILKPASQTPLSSVLLAECMEAAGVPAGVFQMVICDAGMLSTELMQNPICRKISFTGSTRVGQSLIRAAAETIKPMCLELGGLAPVLVFEDCDMEKAVNETIIAKFRNTGQSCIAANRIFVQKTIYKEFVERFTAAAAKLKVGNGLEGTFDVGPVVNQAGLDAALGQIEDAKKLGGRVTLGGKRLADSAGFFLEPTVIENVHGDSLCMAEETFAPIAPISEFDTEEEAIRRANDTPYGLSAYAMTRDIGRVFRLSEQMECGTLGINDGAPTISTAPFGGVKQSGWGRELGIEGLEAFAETKHVSIGGI
jgi:succinate-semialdehyde dehydrogenase/glutarate-semialdehyde dehydrogenase